MWHNFFLKQYSSSNAYIGIPVEKKNSHTLEAWIQIKFIKTRSEKNAKNKNNAVMS